MVKFWYGCTRLPHGDHNSHFTVCAASGVVWSTVYLHSFKSQTEKKREKTPK